MMPSQPQYAEGNEATARPDILFLAANARSLIANRSRLIASLQERGLRVGALVPNYEYQPEVESMGMDIWRYELNRHSMNPLAELRDLARLYRLLRSIRPAAVFAYSIKPILFGVPVARLAGVRRACCLVTGLGYLFSARGFRVGCIRWGCRWLYGLAGALSHVFFFQNPDDREELEKNLLFRRRARSVTVNGSGVDLTEYAECDAPVEPVCFLFMARFLREKGIAEFAAAARRIKAESPHVRFVALGKADPSLRGAVAVEEAEAWKSEGAVEFPGHVADVRPYLRQCSVMVLPSSYREGTPRAILEALSVGRAIITCDVPGCRETVTTGENGYFVRPKCVDDLAAAMQRFIDNPSRIIPMGRASRRIAEEKYDVHQVNATMIQAMTSD